MARHGGDHLSAVHGRALPPGAPEERRRDARACEAEGTEHVSHPGRLRESAHSARGKHDSTGSRGVPSCTGRCLSLAADPHNPADGVALPRIEALPRSLWEAEEAACFIAWSDLTPSRFGSLWLFLLGSGCRLGEALGLRWSDVDFERGVVRVERSRTQVACEWSIGVPKTRAGVRTIKLSSFVMVALHRQRVSQAASDAVRRAILYSVTTVRLRSWIPRLGRCPRCRTRPRASPLLAMKKTATPGVSRAASAVRSASSGTACPVTSEATTASSAPRPARRSPGAPEAAARSTPIYVRLQQERPGAQVAGPTVRRYVRRRTPPSGGRQTAPLWYAQLSVSRRARHGADRA